MTQPQQQPYIAGQIIDRSRTELRSRVYPARTTKWTATVGGVAASGEYSFFISGTKIQYAATVPPDTNDTIAGSLQLDFIGNNEALKIAYATVSGAVVTIEERMPGFGFELTGATQPVGATLDLVDATPAGGDLALGIAVALVDDDPDSIRTLSGSDTAARVFGITAFGPGSELKLNTGNPNDVDVYEEGASVDLILAGPAIVQVETDIAIGDPVFVRKTATGTEVAGAFRNDADGGDAVQLANAMWIKPSYLDRQKRKVARLLIRNP